MNELAAFLEPTHAAYLADLAALVGRDCGTYNKAGVDAIGAWVAARCKLWAWEVEQFPLDQFGDCLLARLRGDGSGRLMLSGHLDTVYPDGTAPARQMRQARLAPAECFWLAGHQQRLLRAEGRAEAQ